MATSPQTKRRVSFLTDIKEDYTIITSKHPPNIGRENLNSPAAENLIEFQAAFGAAIIAWQQIESQIFYVYQTAIGAVNIDACASAFFEVVNFRTRLQMTDSAMKARFGEKSNDCKSWKILSGKIAKKSKRRNYLAHATLFFEEGHSSIEKQLFFADYVGGENIKLNMMDAVYLKEINDLKTSFRYLKSCLINFLLDCDNSIWKSSDKSV